MICCIMFDQNKENDFVIKQNLIILIGDAIIIALIIAYSTLPIVLMWLVGIPLTEIIGITFGVSAYFLRDKNPQNDSQG